MTAITAELAAFVATTSFEDLPARVVERVKIHALDAFASGFVGTHWPWAAMLTEMVTEEGGKGQGQTQTQGQGSCEIGSPGEEIECAKAKTVDA